MSCGWIRGPCVVGCPWRSCGVSEATGQRTYMRTSWVAIGDDIKVPFTWTLQVILPFSFCFHLFGWFVTRVHLYERS